MSEVDMIQHTSQILSHQSINKGVYLTSSNQGSDSQIHQHIQTKIHTSPDNCSTNNIVSALSLDKMILNFSTLSTNPYHSLSSKRRRQKGNKTNSYNHNNPNTPSTIIELPKFNNQPNQTDSVDNKPIKPFVPKSFLISNRDYSNKERELISRIDLKELGTRSPGKGMYIKISQYRNIVRPSAFKLNEDNLLPSNYAKLSDANTHKGNQIKVGEMKYDTSKVFEKDNEQMMRFRAKQRRIEESKSKVPLKNYGRVALRKDCFIKDTIKEKMRDKAMISLMLQFGEKQLMYRLINFQGAVNHIKQRK